MSHIIMNKKEDKTRLKENRDEIKIIKDAIRYQKLLLSAENKLKTKK